MFTAAMEGRHSVSVEIIAGTLGGCAGIVAGHPLDTIKVRLQQQSSQYRGIVHCFATIVRTEKVAGLYRGMAAPLVGVAVINSLLFAVYASALRLVSQNSSQTDIANVFAAGCISGFVNGFVSCPIELSTRPLTKSKSDCRTRTHPNSSTQTPSTASGRLLLPAATAGSTAGYSPQSSATPPHTASTLRLLSTCAEGWLAIQRLTSHPHQCSLQEASLASSGGCQPTPQMSSKLEYNPKAALQSTKPCSAHCGSSSRRRVPGPCSVEWALLL